MNDCKRCLLYEAGEKAAYKTVKDYLETIDTELKTDNETYKMRLSVCKKCENLLSGMCIKCGCYVEVRAALKNSACADFDRNYW